MRLQLTLVPQLHTGLLLPINYQYPLSAAIYKIIAKGDATYAAFLHDTGYKQEQSLKTFKLFTFSDLTVPFKITGDRLIITGKEAQLIICFHVPEAATNFVRGLFLDQYIEIADNKSKVGFFIQQVNVLEPWPAPVHPDEVKEVVLKPISPMVVGLTNSKGYYDFIAPNDERFIPALTHHWREKYRTVYGDEAVQEDFANMELIVLDAQKAKSRLLTIKANTPEETKIRGFVHFRLQVCAKVKVLELALNAGIGAYGSQGFGGVEAMK